MAVYELRVIGTYQGQQFNNVLHFADDAGVGVAGDAQLLADSFMHNDVITAYRNCLDDSAVLNRVEVREIHPEQKDPVVEIPPNGQGLRTGSGMPSYVTAVISFRTGFTAKTKRGRMYMPAVPESFCTDGTMDPAAQAYYQTWEGELEARYLETTGTEPFVLGIWSRKLAGPAPYDPAAFTPVTNITLNTIFGTQRRRRVGHGV